MPSNADEVRLPPIVATDAECSLALSRYNASIWKMRGAGIDGIAAGGLRLAADVLCRERQLLDALRKLAEAEAENARLRELARVLQGGATASAKGNQ